MGDLRPTLDLAHRHDVDAILVVTNGEADELNEIDAGGFVVCAPGGGLLAARCACDLHRDLITHAKKPLCSASIDEFCLAKSLARCAETGPRERPVSIRFANSPVVFERRIKLGRETTR